MSPKTKSGMTPADLLQLWQAAGKEPPAKSFTPTAEQPIMKVVIGMIDEAEVYAYGRQQVVRTVDGRALVRCIWVWHLDPETAMAEANRYEHGKTPQQLLELWLLGRNSPPVESFQPTPQEPVLRLQIGTVGYRSVYVFGWQKHGHYGDFSGGPGRTIMEWRWLLDHDQALFEANIDSYLNSIMAKLWLDAPCPQDLKKTSEPLYVSRMIVPTVGKPFRLYRVVESNGWASWWKICRQEEVCNVLHASFKSANVEEYFPPPNQEKLIKAGTAPDIVDEEFGSCPHCGQSLHRFRSLKSDDGYHFVFHWFYEFWKAKMAREVAAVELSKRKAEREQRQLEQAEINLRLEAVVAAEKVRSSRRYLAFRDQLAPTEMATFEWRQAVHLDEMSLEAAADLELATQKIVRQLTAIENAVMEDVFDHGLDGKLRLLLDELMPKCPLCDQGYRRSDDWLLELLLLGWADLDCGCKGRQYTDAEAPNVLMEYRRVRVHLPTAGYLDQSIRNGLLLKHQVTRVELAGRCAVHTAIMDRSERIRIFVDREVLKLNDKPCVRYVWPQSYARGIEAWQNSLEVQYQGGSMLKLNLRWSDRQNCWYCYGQLDGVEAVFEVHRRHAAGIKGGWYYCQLFNPEYKLPAGVDCPTIGIVPLLPVPSKFRSGG